MTTERSRRSFLKTTMLGGAVTGGALLLPAGRALAADDPDGHGRHCGCPGPNPNPTPTPTPPGGPGGPGTAYRLRAVNNSPNFVDLCIYQGPGEPGTLAWLTRPTPPASSTTFNWTLDYSFVWGNGTLTPGSVFQPGQIRPADPTVKAEQQVELDYVDGQYLFRQTQYFANPQPGNLYIRELSSLPLGDALVGIGVSNAATLVTPTGPNLNLVFEAHPSYHIAAGQFVPGVVLDIEEIAGGSAAVDFPPGIFEMTATLNPDNTWTVRPGIV